MLTLLHPWALALLVAAPVVVLLYFLRMRYRRQRVSSVFLWSRLVEAADGGARLRWRSILLLLLELLAVAALVLALAGLQWESTVRQVPGTLYIVDTSASMAARDPGKGSRLDQAKARILQDYRAIAGQPVAVDAGDRPVFFSETGAGLEAYLAGLQPGDGEFAEAEATDRIGGWLHTHPGPWTAVAVSDGGFDRQGRHLDHLFGHRWRALPVASEVPNLGITSLQVTADDPPQWRIGLFNGFAEPKTLTLTLEKDGRAMTTREEVLPPGSSVAVWTGLSRLPGLWTLGFETADALVSDNTFHLSIERPRAARILHLGAPDAFLRAAFPGAYYEDRAEATTGGGPWDLVLVEDRWPEGWTGNAVTFQALPPDAPVFWSETVTATLSAPTEGSGPAWGRWLPWNEVTVHQGTTLGIRPGVTVLAEAQGAPMVAMWDQGARRVALGMNTRNSNLGLTPTLPLLLAQIRQASVPQESGPQAANLRIGRPGWRAGSADWHVTGSTAASGSAGLRAVRQGTLWELTAGEEGTFAWADGTETGILVAEPPASESDTTPRSLVEPSRMTVTPPQGTWTQTASWVPWLALIACTFLATEWRFWNGRFRPGRHRPMAILRVSAATAALLALGGLVFPWPTQGRNLTLLLDVSESLPPTLREQERQAALHLLARLAPDDRVALVTFAATPRVLSGLQARDNAQASLEEAWLATDDSGQTDLRAALATGVQLLRDSPGSHHQVVFTDGRSTRGAEPGAMPPEVRRFPISVVPVGGSLDQLTARGLEVPPSLRPGDPLIVVWRAESERSRPVSLSVVVDGVAQGTVNRTLTEGLNEVSFALEAGAPGVRSIEVRASTATGEDILSAHASALVPVEGRRSVLMVRGPSVTSALTQSLVRQGLTVEVRQPTQLPEAAAGYQAVSAVVLDNVPATNLTEAQLAHLKNWTAAGGGLLVIGGDRSLGRGEYYSSVLEDLLPVHTDQRQRLQFTRSKLLFVVDHSGSMGETVGNTTKLEAAIGGIHRSLAELAPQDEVGILQFDSEASWVLPFTPLTQKKVIEASLQGFFQGGGTDLTKALAEVTRAFGKPGPVKRHVILLTDGQTSGETSFFTEFSETMAAVDVSVTVIGIGSDINGALLEQIARGAQGIYYRAEGDQVPSILEQETVRVTRDVVQEGSFVPLTDGPDPVVDVGVPPPPVLGYLVTQPKPLARLRWRVQRSDGTLDPLYAEWRYGAGKVAVFTADSGQRWTASWSGRPEYNRFWGQVVHSLEAPARDPHLNVVVSVSASGVHVLAEAQDEARHWRTGAALSATLEGFSVPLTETAPGRYEAELPLENPGIQVVTVTDPTAHTQAWGWVWSPPGLEKSRGGVDWAGLGRLASATGGQLEPLAGPLPPPPTTTWAPVALREWLLGAALVLFLLELVWRSTSLGQAAQAWAQFQAWWQDQKRPWSRPPTPQARTEAESDRRTREAYRYLAGRKRPSSSGS